MTDLQDIQDKEGYRRLFSYWDNIPVVLEISSDIFNDLRNTPVRNFITHILRIGIFDEAKGVKRHALSTKELFPLVNARLEDLNMDKIDLTTLHYHRKKLEQEGLIKEVLKVLKGKTYVHYYGRTAKLYLGKSIDPDSKRKAFKETVYPLLLELNPAIDISYLDKLNERLDKASKNAHEVRVKWLIENRELLARYDVDVLNLFVFFNGFFAADPEYVKVIKEFTDLFKMKY
ncbi:MAG: hypothetical protein ACFFDT_31730 [Candidatus Hodarchaeota archaeon]